MKKFITIALAVAVLFSFAACQQTPVYRNVSYITVEQTEDMLTGQVFDASKFTVTATFTDGTEGPVNVAVESEDGGVTASAKLTIANVGASGAQAILSDSVKVKYYDIESLSLSQTEFTAVKGDSDSLDDALKALSSSTVTAAYANGTMDVTGMEFKKATYVGVVKADGSEAFGSDAASYLATADAGTYDIVIRVGKDAEVIYASIPTDAKLTLSNASEVTVENIVAGFYTGSDDDGYEEVAKVPEWVGDTWTEGDFKVLAVYSDGSMKALTEASDTPSTANSYTQIGTIPTATTGLAKTGVTVNFIYNDDPTKATSYTFVGKDYIASISATTNSTGLPATIKDTDTIQKSWFTVTATNKSNEGNNTNYTGYSFLSTDIPEGTTGKYTVHMYTVNEQGTKHLFTFFP